MWIVTMQLPLIWLTCLTNTFKNGEPVLLWITVCASLTRYRLFRDKFLISTRPNLHLNFIFIHKTGELYESGLYFPSQHWRLVKKNTEIKSLFFLSSHIFIIHMTKTASNVYHVFENNPTFPEQGHGLLLIQGRLCYKSHLRNKPLRTDLNISFTCVFHPFVLGAPSLCCKVPLYAATVVVAHGRSCGGRNLWASSSFRVSSSVLREKHGDATAWQNAGSQGYRPCYS